MKRWLAVLALAAPGCGGGSPRPELAVYAAASTRDALLALESEYEATHGVDLVFHFGSSGDLAKQIVAARKADVFLSAGERELGEVETAGLVLAGSRRDLLANQLVVVEPSALESLFAEPFEPRQLADPRLAHLSLANVETVPAGRYAKAWLERSGVWPSVAARVVPAVDVRAALAAVESGAARAGLVYRTDAAVTDRVRIVHAVPLEEGPRILYPLACLAGREHAAAARELAEFLASPQGLVHFERAGFLPLAESERAR